MRISKPFERQGNFTQVDNDLLDHIMPTLTPSEWMVLSFIIRKTKGWHKDHDGISYSQFIKGTGINSNTTIKKCLDSLSSKNMVLVGMTGNRADPHHYMLNRDYSFGVTESVERPITFSVERPVTESVDTKESLKEKENIGTAVLAYENTFGTITYAASAKLNDDIDTDGETAVLNALAIAKEKQAHTYGYVEKILRNAAAEKESKRAGQNLWDDEVGQYHFHRKEWADLSPLAQKVIKAVGGQAVVRGVKEGYEFDALKRRVMSYAQ